MDIDKIALEMARKCQIDVSPVMAPRVVEFARLVTQIVDQQEELEALRKELLRSTPESLDATWRERNAAVAELALCRAVMEQAYLAMRDHGVPALNHEDKYFAAMDTLREALGDQP